MIRVEPDLSIGNKSIFIEKVDESGFYHLHTGGFPVGKMFFSNGSWQAHANNRVALTENDLHILGAEIEKNAL